MKEIDVNRYKEIRVKPTFLYEYFIECGGSVMPPQQFQEALIMFCMMNGQQPQQGFKTIIDFLDKKFGYK
jgi:hypothetical protein